MTKHEMMPSPQQVVAPVYELPPAQRSLLCAHGGDVGGGINGGGGEVGDGAESETDMVVEHGLAVT